MNPGTRLGHYEVLERLGAGGMGEVWLAQDSRLGRKVALKVLPEQFAGDPERLLRFEQEAKALAALNHPNIAQVFGLEQGEAAVIAMELVDGQDLSRRLSTGALPLEEALPIARQIAAALGAAHDAGIVHRDLKPANVVVRQDGVVKVLDFGLAKAAAPPGSGSQSGMAESPTVLSPAMTATGAIMGTASYMAPEQARGDGVDRRADVWALGCVLYEMLTGRRPFSGDNVAEVMASVLKDPVDFDALPAGTPASIRRLLRRCLRKKPAERLDSMVAFRLEIDEFDGDADAHGAGSASARGGAWPVVAALLAGLVVGAMLWQALWPGSGDTVAGDDRVYRAQIGMPEDLPMSDMGFTGPALSPDGTLLVVAAGLDSESQLYVRRLDSLAAEPIPGTAGAFAPFFSPAGDEVGFFADGVLKKVSLRGDAREVTPLCDAPVSGAGTWSSDGWIYFTFGESRLARVREEGGEPERLASVGEVFSLDALPAGHGIVMTVVQPDDPSIRKDTAEIQVLSPDATTVTSIVGDGYHARYLPQGYLVFMRSGALFAAAFDLERLELTSEPVSVQSGAWADSIWGRARFDVAANGTLIYVPGGDFSRTIPTWVDLASGEEEPLALPPDIYNNFDLSPDGNRLAIHHAGGAQDQVYVLDIRRGAFDRLTLEGSNIYPVWSHDGQVVYFASNRAGDGYRLYGKPVDGSAPATKLLSADQEAAFESGRNWPISVTPDGQYLMVMVWAVSGRGGDLWRVALDGSGTAEPVLRTAANEIIPQVSPDGRWLAYLTDIAGPYRIMARPFPDVERREWALSGNDGYDPRWSPLGDAVLYRQGSRRLMRMPVSPEGDDLAPGSAEVLLEIDFHDAAGSSFAVAPDGRRVLLNRPVEVSLLDATPLTLVVGWATEVGRLVESRRN